MKATGIVAAAVLAIFAAIMFARGNASSPARDGALLADAVGVFYTSGMTCGSCAQKIEAALKETGAVAAVQVDVEKGSVVISFNSQKIPAQTLANKVSSLGYATSVAAVMTGEQYRVVAGNTPGGKVAQQAKAGCGGGCCDKRPAAQPN